MSSFASTELNNEQYPWNYRWKVFWKYIIGPTIPQRLFRLYLLAIVIGSVLLYLPISLKNGYVMRQWTPFDGNSTVSSKSYTFMDAIFISCSALSTTGLPLCDVSETFTIFGQIIIIALIQVGGIGIVTIIYLIWNAFRPKKHRKINQIIILQSERGNEKIGSSFSAIKISVSIILITEVIFAFIYSFWLCWFPNIFSQNQVSAISGLTYDSNSRLNTYHNYGESLWQGLFCSISAINNAGFTDFKHSPSFDAFRNDGNIFFTFLIICEFVFGGIGYPLIFDVIEKIKHKRLKLPYRYSLFTKVAILGFVCVSIVGLAFSYGFEYGYTGMINSNYNDVAHYVCQHGEFGSVEQLNKAWTIFFNTMSTRSAGFQTASQTLLSPGSQYIFIVLMFIGGSPSSTAGGIRTTTLMVVIYTILAKIRGKNDVVMFHKRIPEQRVRDSMIVLVVSIVMLALVAIIVFYTLSNSGSALQDKYSVINSFYEAASAFGTVGLSMGITQNIGNFGLVLLILLMFIGQLGVSSTLLSWTRRYPKGNLIRYPVEDIRIG